jgi:hypothetical protein
VFHVFDSPWYLASLICISLIGLFMVHVPLKKAGQSE